MTTAASLNGFSGVPADFHRGDANALPFTDGSFDLIVCQAAFKNFGDPAGALNEMYRVLRPGSTAVILDMNREATLADIAEEARGMRIGRLNSALTRAALLGLRRRAYSRPDFERLAAMSAFRTCTANTDGLTLEIHLTRPETTRLNGRVSTANTSSLTKFRCSSMTQGARPAASLKASQRSMPARQ